MARGYFEIGNTEYPARQRRLTPQIRVDKRFQGRLNSVQIKMTGRADLAEKSCFLPSRTSFSVLSIFATRFIKGDFHEK
jgi:hypothetical protein